MSTSTEPVWETVALSTLPERYAMFDPAGKKRAGETRRSGRSRAACVVIAVDEWQRTFVVDAWASREPTDVLFDRLIETHLRWRPRLFGVEDVALQDRIREALMIVAQQRGIRVPAIPVQPPRGVDKIFRIESWIQPLLREGKLFVPQHLVELCYELQGFPTARTNDLVDALAYAISLTPTRALCFSAAKELQESAITDYLTESGFSPDEVEEELAAFGLQSEAHHGHDAQEQRDRSQGLRH